MHQHLVCFLEYPGGNIDLHPSEVLESTSREHIVFQKGYQSSLDSPRRKPLYFIRARRRIIVGSSFLDYTLLDLVAKGFVGHWGSWENSGLSRYVGGLHLQLKILEDRGMASDLFETRFRLSTLKNWKKYSRYDKSHHYRPSHHTERNEQEK